MLPVVLALGALGLTMKATKIAGSVLTTAEFVGDKKKLAEAARNFRINENPTLMKHKKKIAKEMAEKGIPTEPEAYVLFNIEKKDIPKELHWLCGTWLLTENEQLRLFDMMRREMLDRQIGSYGEEVKKLCKRHGIAYEDLASACWEGGPSDFEDLRWFSENRLKDPIIRMQFASVMR